jgi:RNA-splicing ligase RtcB
MQSERAGLFWQRGRSVAACREHFPQDADEGLMGIAEEAPGACKDVSAVVAAADHAGLSRTVARLEPVVCITG